MLAPDQRQDSIGDVDESPAPQGGRFRSLASSVAIRRRQHDNDRSPARLLVVGGELEADGGPSGAVEHVSLSLLGDGATVEPTPLTIVPPRSRAAQRRPLLRAGLLIADGLAALFGVIAAEALFEISSGDVAIVIAIAIAGWWATASLLGLYSGNDVRTWASGVSQAPRLVVTALLLSWPLYAAASAIDLPTPAGAALVTIGAAVAASGVLRAVVRAILHQGDQLRQRTLIVGSGAIATDLVHKLRTQTHFGLDPIGFVDDDPHQAESAYVTYCGSLDDLNDVLERHAVDRVIIAFTRANHETLLRCIRTCRDRGVATDIVPRLFELLDGAPGMAQIGGLPLISLTVPRLSPLAGAFKRALDIVVTAVFLLTVLPMIVVISIAIKLESPGPVLFRQERMGRGGRIFDVLKFRSMYTDAEARKRELNELNDLDDGIMFKIYEDPRITRVGRFLRRYSLDELPQLFNVLRGEMSLVGPRPLILDESDVLLEDWHGRRLDLRPGMTGPWQVLGRSDLTVNDMVRFDYAYVSGWSLTRDFEILLATVPAVLSGRGAY